jgi:probable F420-dependent oxidoreductase
MLVVAGMSDRIPLGDTGSYAARVERLGFDVLHVPETVHDSTTVALLALMSTTRLRVQTSLTLAFPRSPMILALQAWDLSRESGGRFDLGLASQIRQNMTGRFSVPWTDPIERMSDYVTSVRAIWRSFSDGSPLDVRTRNYTFDRLQPFFNPGPLDGAAPRVLLGGVNDRAIELAGGSADVYVTHPTNSHPRYLAEVAIPALSRGCGSGPRPSVIATSPVITGHDEAETSASRENQRAVLGFLYSTPAYRRQLEVLGHHDLGERLRSMVRSGHWDRLGELVDDDLLAELLPQCLHRDLASRMIAWFDGLADGVLLQPPADRAHDDEFAEQIEILRRHDSPHRPE